MNTRVCRDLHGSWKAESYIPMTPGRGIRLVTRKVQSGALVTSATCVHIDHEGLESHYMFQDFHKIIRASQVRVTQNAVAAQHDLALASADAIKQECENYYANREKAA